MVKSKYTRNFELYGNYTLPSSAQSHKKTKQGKMAQVKILSLCEESQPLGPKHRSSPRLFFKRSKTKFRTFLILILTKAFI